MRFTRSTPPATAAQLRASAADLTSEIAALAREDAEANATLPDLVGDPAYAAAESRVRELRFLIPSKRDVLARIEAAIPAAEEREAKAAFEEKRAELERRTAKLARKAAKLYPELAGPLADLLHKLEANERECAALNDEAHEHGEQGVRCAEYRARGDVPAARVGGVYRSVLRETQLPSWEGGRPLFDAGLLNASRP